MCPRPWCRVAALPAAVMTDAPVNKATSPSSAAQDAAIVDDLVSRARRAQQRFEAQAPQERYDKAAKAAAWALLEPGRNRVLAELAVRTTGLGLRRRRPRETSRNRGRAIVARVLEHAGAGHSVGLHTSCDDRAIELGRVLPVCRVIVNQAHAIATGGSFDNGLPFSLSMGCGSWGGNSIDENLHWKHFLNVTRVVRTISPDEPSLEDVFADYWAGCGR